MLREIGGERRIQACREGCAVKWERRGDAAAQRDTLPESDCTMPLHTVVPTPKEAASNLTEHAHRSIKRHILSGKFNADSRFTEDFFAQQLGISKSPVREALNTLQSEGLLRIQARRGAYLYRFSPKEVADLYELREALEVFAASIVCITPRLVEQLRASVAFTVETLQADRKQEYIEEDIRFHGAIVEATGNAELVRVHANIQNKLWLCRCQTYRLTSPDTPESHRRLAEAIAAEDRAAACAVTRQHIRLVRESLLADMAAQASLPA